MPDLNASRSLQRIAHGALALLLCLAVGSALAADEGPQRHARGTYDPSTSSYAVVAGDDLSDIAERFGVTVAELKRWNQLASDTIDIGRTLIVGPAPGQAVTGAADASASGYEVLSGKLGAPNARASIGGADHRPQSSFRRLRRDLRAVERLPRVQQHHFRSMARRGPGT